MFKQACNLNICPQSPPLCAHVRGNLANTNQWGHDDEQKQIGYIETSWRVYVYTSHSLWLMLFFTKNIPDWQCLRLLLV